MLWHWLRQHLPARAAWLAAAFVWGVMAAATPSLAQTDAPERQAVSVDDLERLIGTLEDDAERQRLVAQLRTLIEAQRQQAAEPEAGPVSSVIALLSDRVENFADQLSATAVVLGDVPRLLDWVRSQVADPAARERWIAVLGKLFVVLALGLFGDRIVNALLAGARRNLDGRNGHSWPSRLLLAVARLALDLVPIAVFAALAYLALPLLSVKGEARSAALLIIVGYVAARAVLAAALAVLAPRAPGLRLLPVSDETANYLYIWARRLVGVTVYGFVAIATARLLGLPASSYGFALKVLGLIVAAMLVILVLQNRGQVGDAIRGSGEEGGSRHLRGLRNRLADVWHVLAVLYVVVIYGIWALNVRGGFEYVSRASLLTVVVLALAAVAATAARRIVARAFSISHDLRSEFPQLEARANRYLPVLYGVLRGGITVITVLALLQAWGINSIAWLTSDFGGRMVSGLLSIAAVVIVALIVWELASSAIERYLTQTDGEGHQVERSARARTLLPLLRNVIMVFLVVMVVLIALSELGINIAPLLAGAGVVGLAIGFGSQKLVQDLITGAFILFEDTIAVGDVVKLGEHSGVVEAISIRTIRLRDLTGSVHTIPFSTVGTVVNLTKDFSFYAMEVGIAYREDTDEVVAVLRQLGEELMADPDFGHLILAPLEVLGVDRFDASSVVIKARIKTLPVKQWSVGREFNRRMKKRFDELGIEIPFPHTTIYFGEDKKGRAPPARIRVEGSPGGDGQSVTSSGDSAASTRAATS